MEALLLSIRRIASTGRSACQSEPRPVAAVRRQEPADDAFSGHRGVTRTPFPSWFDPSLYLALPLDAERLATMKHRDVLPAVGPVASTFASRACRRSTATSPSGRATRSARSRGGSSSADRRALTTGGDRRGGPTERLRPTHVDDLREAARKRFPQPDRHLSAASVGQSPNANGGLCPNRTATSGQACQSPTWPTTAPALDSRRAC